MMPRFGLTRLASLFVLLIAGCAQPFHYNLTPKYSIADPEFVSTMGNLLGPPILAGNEITTLRNGDEIFPAMLTAIRQAKQTLTLETYVFWKGSVGRQFTDALCERARAGAKVHVIIDWLGSDRIDPKYISEMRAAGAKVVLYHVLKWYDFFNPHHLDHRTHRKLLIADGRVGLIGGVGIADEWAGDARDNKEYRENHYLVRGPVVAQLQGAFCENWVRMTGQVLHGREYFPLLESPGRASAQVFKSSPFRDGEGMQLAYLLSIAASRQHIRLANAYFVPDEQMTRALLAARKRGVIVEIIVPGKNMDVEVVRSASRAAWGPLLRAGIHIYEYQPTMYHVKLAIFDDRWTSVGSCNLDPRSWQLNDEANLNVLDVDFARTQIALFEADKLRAHEVTYHEWAHRSAGERIGEMASQVIKLEL